MLIIDFTIYFSPDLFYSKDRVGWLKFLQYWKEGYFDKGLHIWINSDVLVENDVQGAFGYLLVGLSLILVELFRVLVIVNINVLFYDIYNFLILACLFKEVTNFHNHKWVQILHPKIELFDLLAKAYQILNNLLFLWIGVEGFLHNLRIFFFHRGEWVGTALGFHFWICPVVFLKNLVFFFCEDFLITIFLFFWSWNLDFIAVIFSLEKVLEDPLLLLLLMVFEALMFFSHNFGES